MLSDASTLVAVASIVGSFAVAMLTFRVSRELCMESKGETTWIPWCDRLLLAGLTAALLLVVVPATTGLITISVVRAIAAAACGAATVLATAYPFALLAHYRLLLGRRRTGARDNPEPGERAIVWVAVGLAAAVFLWTLMYRLQLGGN